MKQVLITGAGGFLGKHLHKTLTEQGVACETFSSREIDLRDRNALHKIPQKPYDHIFHLAAWTQAGTFCDTHRGIQWMVNQQINTHVLDWWLKEAPQAKMIAFGTSVSYAPDAPLHEDFYMQGAPYDKFYAYAHCKRMLLVGLECLQRQYGMRYLYLIPSTLYGPGYPMDGRQLHFIYDLIRKLLRGKLLGDTVTLWGDGEQRRELVYVDDFVQVMLQLNEVAENTLFNLGGGMDYSIREFAEQICAHIGYDASLIQYDATQYVGARSKILDIQNYQQKIPAFRQTPLSEGLAKTIEWMQANQDHFLYHEAYS